MMFARQFFFFCGWFILLQIADFVLTSKLLSQEDIYEANPVAFNVLHRYGYFGLALFKGACTVLVLMAATMVWQQKARAGTRLLVAICTLMVLVNGYSLGLYVQSCSGKRPELAMIGQIKDEQEQLDTLLLFQKEREGVCQDLLEGRTSLTDAVERMARTIDAFRQQLPPYPRATLPPAPQRWSVAVYLLYHARLQAGDAPCFHRMLSALQGELALQYPQAAGVDQVLIPGHRPAWAPVAVHHVAEATRDG